MSAFLMVSVLVLHLKYLSTRSGHLYLPHVLHNSEIGFLMPKPKFPHRLSTHSGSRLALPNTNSNPQYVNKFRTGSNHDMHMRPKWCCRHHQGIHGTPAEETCISSAIQIVSFYYHIRRDRVDHYEARLDKVMRKACEEVHHL